MKITIIHDSDINEPEITVRYGYLSKELEDLLSYVSLADNTITGKLNDETYFIKMADILYFETVDRKVFFYTADKMFETKSKIYQIEEKLINTPFARISKSVIVNLRKVKCINPEKHSKLCATLVNGERLMVSRQYLNVIKDKLGV